jgi:transcriptional regulator with XRE-family HTH domain
VARYDPDNLVRAIGRRVAELRREQGLTQQALAGKLRATMQWVQQIEYGANLTVHSLARVANALNVQLEALLVPPNLSSYVRRPGRPPSNLPVALEERVAATNTDAPKRRKNAGRAQVKRPAAEAGPRARRQRRRR